MLDEIAGIVRSATIKKRKNVNRLPASDHSHTIVSEKSFWSDLPSQDVFPASPMQMAQTSVDFPVPFGPMTTFRKGPGKGSERMRGRLFGHRLN